MFGWCGKVLIIDLTSRTLREESLEPKVLRDYLGGRGLGIYYLLKEGDPRCNALGPENIMVMSVGPLTGSSAPTGARYMVTTKSPLTGAITCANSGGMFPAMLKKAGWDALVIKGRSNEPVYLWINGQEAELRPAYHLAGLTTHETEDKIRGETDPRAKVACIGPAGENLVSFSSIMNDKHRAAGRSGVGAVMGSKNLKAVAVLGTGVIRLADEARFRKLVRDLIGEFKKSTKDNPPPLRLYGTAVTAGVTQHFGALPTRNFRTGTFEGWAEIDGHAISEKILKRAKACYSCPIACGRGTALETGKYRGAGEGPEYETVYSMGSNCGINDLEAITKANYLCNELGMDTISMGATIACAMELYELGLISEKEIGRSLNFGDSDALVELTEKTAFRRGFGAELAKGSLRLASKYGRPDLAMVSKGQEFAGYDPRAEQGMGLAYATSPIGASHMRGDPAYIELLGVPKLIDPLTWEDKPAIVKSFQDVFCLIDAAGLCVFYSIRNLCDKSESIPPSGILELVNAATGADYTMEEFLAVGERIFNAERIFLNRAGFDRSQDRLPPRMTREPMPSGPAKGKVCNLEKMLDKYYALRDWDMNGYPTDKKLEELGLRDL